MAISLPPIHRDITTDPTDRANQHWVPRSYLKAWCDPSTPDGAYLWVSPKDRSTAPVRRSPKKAFTSRDMNTMRKGEQRNLSLETMFHSIETNFGNVKDKIASGTQPIESDLQAVVDFVAAQLVRTPKFRGSWRFAAQGDHEAQLATLTDPLERTAIEDTLANIVGNSSQILSFYALSEALRLLGKMRMRLYKSTGDMEFITSDSPCCVVEYRDSIASIFECLESPTSNVTVPLCPSVVAIFDHSSEPDEMTELLPNHPIVHEINAMIWNGAVERVVLARQTLRPEWFSEGMINKLARYAVL